MRRCESCPSVFEIDEDLRLVEVLSPYDRNSIVSVEEVGLLALQWRIVPQSLDILQ